MTIVGMDAEVPPGAVVVVIDVIRAFTTAAVAFERGATDIVCVPSVEAGRNFRRLHPDRLLVGDAAARCALVCTGRTAEDWACAKYLSDLVNGSEPRREDLVAGIMDGAAEQVRAYARKPPSDRVDLSGDLPFCGDVDRSAFAMVGEIRAGYVTLARVPC